MLIKCGQRLHSRAREMTPVKTACFFVSYIQLSHEITQKVAQAAWGQRSEEGEPDLRLNENLFLEVLHGHEQLLVQELWVVVTALQTPLGQKEIIFHLNHAKANWKRLLCVWSYANRHLTLSLPTFIKHQLPVPFSWTRLPVRFSIGHKMSWKGRHTSNSQCSQS